MRKTVFIIIGLLLVAFLVLGFAGERIWNGEFSLPIRIVRSGRPVDAKDIDAVHYTCGFPRPNNLESIRFLAESESLENAALKGDAYAARVPFSGTDSFFGLHKTTSQFRSIYIRIRFSNGRTLAVACPVSDKEFNPTVIIDVGELGVPPPASQPTRPAAH